MVVPDRSDASGHEPGHTAHSTAAGVALHLTGASPMISIKIPRRPFIFECRENGEPFQCLKRILTAQFNPRFKGQSAKGSTPPCVKEPWKKNRDEHQRTKPGLPQQQTGHLNISCPIQPLAFPQNPHQGGGQLGPPIWQTARASARMWAVE